MPLGVDTHTKLIPETVVLLVVPPSLDECLSYIIESKQLTCRKQLYTGLLNKGYTIRPAT